MTTEKTDDWLIKNAIGCWLHHFPNHPWTSRYQELVKRDVYLAPTSKPQPARKGRSQATAKRSQSRSKDSVNATTRSK